KRSVVKERSNNGALYACRSGMSRADQRTGASCAGLRGFAYIAATVCADCNVLICVLQSNGIAAYSADLVLVPMIFKRAEKTGETGRRTSNFVMIFDHHGSNLAERSALDKVF